MANNEVPEWEGSPKKPSLFRKSNPFSNLSLPDIDKPKSFFSAKKSPFSTRTFNKEIPGEETVGETSTTAEEISPKPRRTFYGLSRRTCIILIVVLVAVIALIIGLAVGLTHSSSSKAKNLPLPSNTATFTGDLTYYSPGPGYGACGFENTSEDSICAVSHVIWDAASTSSNPNNNPLCKKKIRITRYDASVGGNRSVDVEVVDRCVGCQATDLDLSLKMFTSLADESLGRVVGSWAWLD